MHNPQAMEPSVNPEESAPQTPQQSALYSAQRHPLSGEAFMTARIFLRMKSRIDDGVKNHIFFLLILQINCTRLPFGSHLELQSQQGLNWTILRSGGNNSNQHQMCPSSVSNTVEHWQRTLLCHGNSFAHTIRFDPVQNRQC